MPEFKQNGAKKTSEGVSLSGDVWAALEKKAAAIQTNRSLLIEFLVRRAFGLDLDDIPPKISKADL